jgi:type II secretory pathway component GspD/PulD (secretin)
MNAGLKLRRLAVRMSFALALGALSGPLGAEEPAAPPPPPAQPSGADAEAQKLLEEQVVSDKKLQEEISTQATQHYQAGLELFKRFNYEAAKHELELAVQLAPGNEEARKLLTRVNDILGVRQDRIKSAVAQLYGQHKIEVQEKLVELDNRIDLAKRFIDEAQTDSDLSLPERIRRYEQAVTALERGKELIKWMAVDVPTEEQANTIERLLGETHKAIKAVEGRLREVDLDEAEKLAREQHESERAYFARRINTMVDQANTLVEIGQYEAALSQANRILALDPTNAEAHTIIAVSKDNEHTQRLGWNDEEYHEQRKLTDEREQSMEIPWKDYLIYPANWREIAQRTSQENERKAQEPWKEEMRRKLARKVTFEFVETPLAEALRFLSDLTKVNIILDPKVVGEGADKVPITLKVTDMDLEQALRWVLRLAELEYDFRNQAVFITRKANLTSNIELQIYDIRDLTTAITDFPGPRIEAGVGNQASGTGGVGVSFTEPAAAAPGLQAADLVALIKDKLLSAEFGDPGTSIEDHEGKLVVMQRPEVQEKIRQLLKSFRETQTIQVLTNVRMVDVNEDFLEEIGVDFEGLDAAVSDAGITNPIVNPLSQPSRWGLFPNGGGPGLASLPTDIQPSPAYQFANFIAKPPYVQKNPAPNAPILLLHPRLSSQFPTYGNEATGPAYGAVGIRHQWWSSVFGSPALTEGVVQNFIRPNPLSSILGQNLQSNPQQGIFWQFRLLQSTQANAILIALRKEENSEVLLAPKLMQYNNQRAHVLVCTQTAYISDYTISGTTYDPTISTLMTGVVLEVRPTVSHDKRYITMEVRPGVASEPKPPEIVDIGGGVYVLPIYLPYLELRSMDTTVTIPDNGTMFFSGLITDGKFDAKSGIPLLSDLPIIGRIFCTNYHERVRRNLLVLLNARIILFNEEEANL